jgi:hypothetical protein
MSVAKLVRTTPCMWSQNNPEGLWAVEGPESELRKGSVVLPNKLGVPITVVLGTPQQYRGVWYAHIVRYPMHQDGGSWWTDHWRLDRNLSFQEPSANGRPLVAFRGRKSKSHKNQ